MKKHALLSLLLLCACALLPSAGVAADYASANEVNTRLLRVWASEEYGCSIDKDGDLIVKKKSEKLVVSVISKVHLIRVAGYFKRYDKLSISEMIRLANKFNNKKRVLRVSIDPDDGNIICDYYLIYDGGLNKANFLSVLDWVFGLKDSWENFVINVGKED